MLLNDKYGKLRLFQRIEPLIRVITFKKSH